MINSILTGNRRTRNMFFDFVYSVNEECIFVSFTINSWKCSNLLICCSLICNICKWSRICRNSSNCKSFWTWNWRNLKWTIINRRSSSNWIIATFDVLYFYNITSFKIMWKLGCNGDCIWRIWSIRNNLWIS